MKKLAILLSITTLFTMSASLTGSGTPDSIVLTASMVSGAADIENAISLASNTGTRPGTVILDSSEGDFVFDGEDRTINIFYSNITLRSWNGATISNCGDGVFFDPVTANNVKIAGINFNCENLGIYGGVGHQNVTVRDNTFLVGSFAIEAEDAVNWIIAGNQTSGPDYAIFLRGASNSKVINNILAGYAGVHLVGSSHNHVVNNQISGSWHGIYLGIDSSYNKVIANQIMETQHSGITFGGGNEYNRVIANQVSCAEGFACLLIEVENPPLSPTNMIQFHP